MITPASDYRPIDKRPVRWLTAVNPLSLQRRGLVQWIPCGRIDLTNRIISDRRHRPVTSVSLPASWLVDEYRGLYGMFITTPVLAGDPEPLPRAGEAQFVPAVNTVPLTITFWVRHYPGVWAASGFEVFLGDDTTNIWHAFITSLDATMLTVIQAENSDFSATATVSVPVTVSDWHFCAAVFVSNSERFAYCDGKAGTHNTASVTPTATKNVLRLGSGGAGIGYPSPASGSTLRDIRVYNYALTESELLEMYRNPYDLYGQYDRDDDYARVVVVPEHLILPPFIASTSQVFAPTVTVQTIPTLYPPFIASTAEIFTPAVLSPLTGSQVGKSQFPANVDEAKNLIIAANNASATLEAMLDSSTLTPFTLTLSGDLSNFAASGAITIDASIRTAESSEILYYDGKVGQSLSITRRAQDGTIAQSFEAGASVEMREIARHHNLVAETLIAVETEVLSQKASLEDQQGALDDVNLALDGKLSTSGGTLTGPLILSGAPALDLHAATKAYVDNSVIVGGGGGALPYGTFWIGDFGASGSATTTTGSIASGTNTLTVANAASFAVGHGIYVAGAGASGVNLITTITAIAGTTITLAANAATTVSNVKVQHDETTAIQTAINLIQTIHSLTLLFDNGTYRINGPVHATNNSILTVPHSPYNQGTARTLRMFGQSTMMADVLSTPSPQGTIIQSDQTGTNANSSMFNLGGPYEGNSFGTMFFLVNSGVIDIRDMYWRTHDNPRISAIDLWMGNNVFLTNVTVDTGHNPQGALDDDSLAGAEPTHNTFGIRLPRVSTLSQTNNVSITNYSIGLIYSDLFTSISLFIQRCKTALYTRGHDYPATGTILIVQCGTGLYVEGGNAFGRPGLDCTFKYEIDPRGLGHWWETLPGKYIVDPTDILFGQLKYYVVQGYVAGVGMPITVTGTTHLTKINLHA
jgi:hypothetical protein